MVAELRLQEVLTEIEIARADVLNDIDLYKPTFSDELATILNKVAHLIEKTETSFKTLQNKFQEDKENETQYRFKIDTKMNEHNTNIVNAVGGFVNAFGVQTDLAEDRHNITNQMLQITNPFKCSKHLITTGTISSSGMTSSSMRLQGSTQDHGSFSNNWTEIGRTVRERKTKMLKKTL